MNTPFKTLRTLSFLSLLFLTLLLAGNGFSHEGEKDCKLHSECPSGVCNHIKADFGHCAPKKCKPGEKTDNNNFYCKDNGKWQASKKAGEVCVKDLECFQPTCFMNPRCDVMPKKVSSCKEGKCILVGQADLCEAKGMKRVLAAEEWIQSSDGRCMESMAQRVLRTVCVPCGNGKCDPGESVCNCSQDCKK